MLDLLLFLCLITLELIHYFERKRLVEIIANKKEMPIPKARQSFVIRNMNEKLKEALFSQDNKK